MIQMDWYSFAVGCICGGFIVWTITVWVLSNDNVKESK